MSDASELGLPGSETVPAVDIVNDHVVLQSRGYTIFQAGMVGASAESYDGEFPLHGIGSLPALLSS